MKGLFILFAALLAAIVLAPFAFPFGTFVHLDGSPSMMDHDWSGYGIGGMIYALGDLLCHQDMARSFILNGSQLPFCGRDVGLLIGFVAGILIDIRMRTVLSSSRMLLVGILLMVLTAAEWALEMAAGFDSQELRFILGIISGIGAAMVVGYAMYKNAGSETLL